MKTLYIGFLPYGFGEEDLRKILQAYGPIGKIQVFADWKDPKGEPHAFAEVEQPEQAVLDLDGKKIGAAQLRVHLKAGAQ